MTFTPKPAAPPEPLREDARPMTGLVRGLSQEQKSRLLGMDSESFGNPALPKIGAR